ncbi:uncharacterized protein TNCV_2625571 [Trichonephila clavipes]|nr:uncharacterized protein TNCV_2625571 [Trichonephila clavipes]
MTDDHRKTGSGRRKVTSARHLLRMVVNDRTASSKQLAARWSTATGALMSASQIRGRQLHRRLRARAPLYRIPFTTTIDDNVRNGLISTELGTSVKCYSPKSFPSFKASLELFFSKIIHAHML